ncbi:unnamed protein product [Pleuronectes platessa]|uniref:Uncharacterized protein n=1 Tax=Pleuronectes platessa TaxID=8262 RepID=A0A9N7VNF5_PLEPL|nr:unnamed protein product [Pleuronectes platessa]
MEKVAMLDNHTAGWATTYCLCCRGGRDKEGETLTTITAGPGSQPPCAAECPRSPRVAPGGLEMLRRPLLFIPGRPDVKCSPVSGPFRTDRNTSALDGIHGTPPPPPPTRRASPPPRLPLPWTTLSSPSLRITE